MRTNVTVGGHISDYWQSEHIVYSGHWHVYFRLRSWLCWQQRPSSPAETVQTARSTTLPNLWTMCQS